jgi:D-glycero-alpha-D-manno-heptose-7-phosphate kinase
MTTPLHFRARAPLRLSFCGGGTDVSPYLEEHGGLVLSATIDQYAHVSLRPRRDTRFTIASLDYDQLVRFDHPRRMKLDGTLDLIKAAVHALKVRRGADLWVHSDAPPGSGLGSSSTLCVALLGALAEWLDRPLDGYPLAELAYRIERIDLGLAGGKQDQYAATFGGFNFIEFEAESTVVNPLRIRPSVVLELESRLVLCYLGRTRASANLIEKQVANYRRGRRATVQALHRLKRQTLEMKKALLLGDLDGLGALLHEAWEDKKQLEPSISTSHIDRVYEVARKAGALGGKMPGAGGGGYFLFLTRWDRRHLVAAALQKQGGQVVPFQFEPRGLLAWKAPRE